MQGVPRVYIVGYTQGVYRVYIPGIYRVVHTRMYLLWCIAQGVPPVVYSPGCTNSGIYQGVPTVVYARVYHRVYTQVVYLSGGAYPGGVPLRVVYTRV